MLQSKFGDFSQKAEINSQVICALFRQYKESSAPKTESPCITSFSSNCKGSKSVTHKQNRCHAVLPNRLNN